MLLQPSYPCAPTLQHGAVAVCKACLLYNAPSWCCSSGKARPKQFQKTAHNFTVIVLMCRHKYFCVVNFCSLVSFESLKWVVDIVF